MSKPKILTSLHEGLHSFVLLDDQRIFRSPPHENELCAEASAEQLREGRVEFETLVKFCGWKEHVE